MFDGIKKGAKAISYFLIVMWILLGAIALPLLILTYSEGTLAILFALLSIIGWLFLNGGILATLLVIKTIWDGMWEEEYI